MELNEYLSKLIGDPETSIPSTIEVPPDLCQTFHDDLKVSDDNVRERGRTLLWEGGRVTLGNQFASQSATLVNVNMEVESQLPVPVGYSQSQCSIHVSRNQ